MAGALNLKQPEATIFRQNVSTDGAFLTWFIFRDNDHAYRNVMESLRCKMPIFRSEDAR